MLISNSHGSHKNSLAKLISLCDTRLVIVSPFLASNMCVMLANFDFSKTKIVELITTFKKNDPEQVIKPFQLDDFFTFFKKNHPEITVKVHINNDLHGKLYFSLSSEGNQLIITSANFTQNGLVHNHEWGVEIQNDDIIYQALEEVFATLSVESISHIQIRKACEFAGYYKDKFDTWKDERVVDFDILSKITALIEKKKDPKYFLKPIGSTEDPIHFSDKEDFSDKQQELHFSKKKPLSVNIGDILITTGVGSNALISYFSVTGSPIKATDEEMEREVWRKRWQWSVEGLNRSRNFSKNWWKHKLLRNDLVMEFTSLNPDIALTKAGNKTLGAFNFGADKIQITEEFAQFLIDKIEACS
jgi:HKD family nuclease